VSLHRPGQAAFGGRLAPACPAPATTEPHAQDNVGVALARVPGWAPCAWLTPANSEPLAQETSAWLWRGGRPGNLHVAHARPQL